MKIERTYDDGSVETTYLQDSTQFGDVPEFSSLDSRSPVAGDYSIYESYGPDGYVDSYYAQYVHSVEGGIVEYENYTTTIDASAFDSCTVEEFAWAPSEYDVHVGMSMFESEMGTFLCDVYRSDTGVISFTSLVDSVSGVLLVEELSVNGEPSYKEVLTYSTYVSSDWPYEGLRDVNAGDYGVYSYLSGNAEGITGCGTVIVDAETVYDGTPSVTVSGLGFSDQMDWYPIFTMEGYEAVGTETVCTYYGDLVCDVVVTESADVTMTYLVHDGVIHRERAEFSDGTWMVMDTVFNTVLEHPLSPDESFIADPEVGDRLLYHMYVDNIYHSDVTVEIVSARDGVYELSLSGGDTMTVTEDRLLSGAWMTDGFEFRGNAYIGTDNGYRYMDVYTNMFEEGKVTVFVGSDGVPYFVNCTLSDGTKYMLDFADASWVY